MSIPTTISAQEVEQLRRDLDGAREALDEVETENAELRRQRDALKQLEDAESAAEVLLSEDEYERFEQLVADAKRQMKDFDDIVLDTIWGERFSSGLLRPWQDEYRAEQADKNVDAGLLWIDDDAVFFIPTMPQVDLTGTGSGRATPEVPDGGIERGIR